MTCGSSQCYQGSQGKKVTADSVGRSLALLLKSWVSFFFVTLSNFLIKRRKMTMGTSIHLFIARFLLFASLFFIKFKRIFFLTAMYVNTNVIKSKVFGNFMEFDWNWKL